MRRQKPTAGPLWLRPPTRLAETAYQVVHRELKATERHQRAIERIRVPRLESELATLVLRLDELERQERMVSRWASLRLHPT